jgi:hypothetical protein
MPSLAVVSAAPEDRPMILLTYLDVVVVAIGTPIAIVLGAPAFGCLMGAAGWIIQRVIHYVDRRYSEKVSEPRKQLGFNLFEAFGRIWLLAGAIIVAGVAGGRADGLAAALTIFAAYSISFVVRITTGPPEQNGPRPTRNPPGSPA